MKKLPNPPKPPSDRIISEGVIFRNPIIIREGAMLFCPKCQSSMVRTPFIFNKKYCINPECSNSKKSEILEKCKEAVEKEIRKECRKEALKILTLGDDKDRKDFLKYHKKNQGNICCLALDFAKKKLVESGKIKQNKRDCFHYSY